MSAVDGRESAAPEGRDPRVPHVHPPRRDGDGSEQAHGTRVVWLAYGWDMAAVRLTEVAPGSEDLGPVRVTGWSRVVAEGRVVATRGDGVELWGRAWRVDEPVCAALSRGRHPLGVLEFVVAVDAFDRSLDARMLALADPSTSGRRPDLLEAGWALRGAAEARLPLRWRRHLRVAPLRRPPAHGPVVPR